MAEEGWVSIPFIVLNEGRTYGQPEVVLISLPQVVTGLRYACRGSFRRGFRKTCSCRRGHSCEGVPTVHPANQKKMLSEINAGYGRKGDRIMAIFHFTVKIVRRSKGKSVVHRHILMEMVEE